MSIDKLHAGFMQRHINPQRLSDSRAALDKTTVGATVTVRINSKLGLGRYAATIGDSRYIVASDLALEVGSDLRATVSSLGEVVELKYLGAGQYQLSESETQRLEDSPNESVLQLKKLQTKYKVELSAADQDLVASLADEVTQPRTMAMSAFFLNKLGEKIESTPLRALYQSQVWAHSNANLGAVAADLSILLKGVQESNKKDADTLALIMGDACESHATREQVGIDLQSQSESCLLEDTESRSQSHTAMQQQNNCNAEIRDLAARLLNMQDAGALGYHYGSLPVMIDGQMLELDLVLFHERESSRPHRQQGLRKLIMTLKTESLGKVEIVAQSIDSVLSVSIGTQSPQATEKLAGHAQEVRELVGRLGWNVDSVSYRLSNEPARSAAQLVRHVVSAGSLDAVV